MHANSKKVEQQVNKTGILCGIEPSSLPKKKTDNENTEQFYIIATNFNESLMDLTHIGSDYFIWLLLSKFPEKS